jgi:cell division protein FtsW
VDEHGLDKLLIFAIAALTMIGLVMVYSSSYTVAMEATKAKDSSLFLRNHIVRLVLGAMLFYLFARSGEKALRRLAMPLVCLSIALLALTLIPTDLRMTIRGSSRWLRFGHFSFQPSEIAKLALILYIADFAARKGDDITRFSRGFLPAFLVIASVAGLVAFEPNLGTAMMLLVIGLVVLFAGGARLLHLGASLVACSGLALLAMRVSGYNWDRIASYLKSPGEGLSYHVQQSLIAIGAGGLGGVGIGMSNQKYLFVPDAHTDFVFAIAAEELGFLGLIGIIALFFIFVWRGLRAAKRAQTVFSSVAATGITMTTAAYFCVSACVCTGTLPTAGLPMPFMSYGGSSAMVLLASCGMLVGVSRRHRTFLETQPDRWRDLVR